ncbi:MAG: hypothetical protein ABI388_12920 [Bacteroidia bacterium]
MKKILVALLILFQTLALAQSVKVSTVTKPVISLLFGSGEDTVLYPIITAESDAVSKKINEQIKRVYIDSVYLNQPLDLGLDSVINSGLIAMSYEVTYNKKNILSLTINGQGCGAYCSDWRTFFNFNTETGNSITLNDILKIDKIESFKQLVLKRKTEELIAHKEELAEEVKKKEIDADNYHWAIEEIDSNCIKSISLVQFSLSDTQLEIIDDCEFPHVIRFIEPSYKLNYTYSTIKEFLSPLWETILMK